MMATYNNDDESRPLDAYFDVLHELRPITFRPVDPVRPGAVTFRATYDIADEEAVESQTVEVLASARVWFARDLVEYCRNVRVWVLS